jgi:hypothetical protein
MMTASGPLDLDPVGLGGLRSPFKSRSAGPTTFSHPQSQFQFAGGDWKALLELIKRA